MSFRYPMKKGCDACLAPKTDQKYASAWQLCLWLNEFPDDPPRQRIAKVLDRLEKLEKHREPARAALGGDAPLVDLGQMG